MISIYLGAIDLSEPGKYSKSASDKRQKLNHKITQEVLQKFHGIICIPKKTYLNKALIDFANANDLLNNRHP